MTPINILQRTFQIKYKNVTGTCFTIEKDDRQYIVTAHHVVKGIGKKDAIELFHDNQWKTFDVRLIGLAPDQYDIAVLAANELISPLHSLIPTTAEIFLSQDVYFLGFPYGLKIDIDAHMNNCFPLPLVKKGIISSLFFNDNQADLMFIDGINNPGFSGGPVYFNPVGNNRKHCVAAVISGYRFNWEPIFVNGKEINAHYQQNTGIIIAYTINHAIDLIDKNPNGFKIIS